MILHTSRLRELNTLTQDTALTEYVLPGSSTVHTIEQHFGNSGMSATVMDTPHPNWKRHQKYGVRTMGDVSVVKFARVVDPGLITDKGPPNIQGYDYKYSGSLAYIVEGQPQGSPPDDENASGDWNQNILLKAYAKANSGCFMLGENLNELGQTVQMLRRPLQGSLNLLRNVNRNYQRALKASLKAELHPSKIYNGKNSYIRDNTVSVGKAFANAELEVRYGMTPLLLDLQKGITMVHDKRERCDRRGLVARAGQKFCYDDAGSINSYPNPEWALEGSWSYISNRSCSAGVFYDVASRTKIDDLLTILGLRGRDLVPTMWEITPLSFVADWFVNVGDWLQAITPVPGITFGDNWVTSVNDTMRKCNGYVAFGPNGPQGRTYTGSYGGSTVNYFNYVRKCNERLSRLPVPVVRKLSTLKQIDGLSLIVQQIIVETKKLPRR